MLSLHPLIHTASCSFNMPPLFCSSFSTHSGTGSNKPSSSPEAMAGIVSAHHSAVGGVAVKAEAGAVNGDATAAATTAKGGVVGAHPSLLAPQPPQPPAHAAGPQGLGSSHSWSAQQGQQQHLSPPCLPPLQQPIGLGAELLCHRCGTCVLCVSYEGGFLASITSALNLSLSLCVCVFVMKPLAMIDNSLYKTPLHTHCRGGVKEEHMQSSQPSETHGLRPNGAQSLVDAVFRGTLRSDVTCT